MSERFRIQTERCLLVWSAPDGDDLPAAEASALPRLREQTAYTVFLRGTDDASVALVHRDPVLLRGLRSSDGGRVVHGTVDFGGQIGRSVFGLWIDGEPHADFAVEVIPTKLDYEQDYTRLVDETQQILTGLVLEYLRSTFQLGRGAPVTHPTRLEWLTLPRTTADDLERALDRIARHPQWALARTPQPVRAERVRRPDAALRRAVLRRAGTGRRWPLPEGAAVRERVDERRARATLDTPEHRWLAARLGAIRRGRARLHRDEAERQPDARRDTVVGEIAALEGRIARLAALPPLAAATGSAPPDFASLQLAAAPGYREARRACEILTLGLHLDGGPVHLALKDLHLLYEQWCFLALVRLLAEALGQPLPAPQLLAAEGGGLRVRLRRGWEHAVAFDDGARRIALVYNPRFGADPLLVPQRPDVLLEIRAPGRTAGRRAERAAPLPRRPRRRSGRRPVSTPRSGAGRVRPRPAAALRRADRDRRAPLSPRRDGVRGGVAAGGAGGRSNGRWSDGGR